MAQAKPPPAFQFHVDPSLASFEESPKDYLHKHPDPRYDYIATGTIVMDTLDSLTPRVLLLQRAAGDSMPGQWETPGGGCDDEDESIVHSAARELWEEAGLVTKAVLGVVGEPYYFTSRSGKKICKHWFLVEVERVGESRPDVMLDPKEHQQYVWASEKEIKTRKTVSDVELNFTDRVLEETVLEAFRLLEQKDANPYSEG